MPMEQDKFGSFIRETQENSNRVNSPFDASILNMASSLDSQAMFGAGLSDLMVGRKKEAIDKVFAALVSEANQELADVPRDVRTESQDGTSTAAGLGR